MDNSQNRTVCLAGFRAGLAAFIFTLAFSVIQLLQVLRFIRFPTDEILIYACSLAIVIPYVLEILALHYSMPLEKKFWSHAVLIFTTIYAVFVTANYVVQLATVIPGKLSGAYALIRILDQTPHSFFWDFDAIGYIFMGLGSLMAIPLFSKTGFQKWIRLSFLANGLVTPLIAVVYFYPVFNEKLLLLGFPWGITAPLSMLLLALFFRRSLKTIPGEHKRIN